MILYHGSNVGIESVDLSHSSVGKDFGCGFYLTASKEQAERMGRRRARLYGGEMVVTSFEFNEDAAREAGLNIKEFESYSKEWAISSSQTVKMTPGRKFTISILSMVPLQTTTLDTRFADYWPELSL